MDNSLFLEKFKRHVINSKNNSNDSENLTSNINSYFNDYLENINIITKDKLKKLKAYFNNFIIVQNSQKMKGVEYQYKIISISEDDNSFICKRLYDHNQIKLNKEYYSNIKNCWKIPFSKIVSTPITKRDKLYHLISSKESKKIIDDYNKDTENIIIAYFYDLEELNKNSKYKRYRKTNNAVEMVLPKKIEPNDVEMNDYFYHFLNNEIIHVINKDDDSYVEFKVIEENKKEKKIDIPIKKENEWNTSDEFLKINENIFNSSQDSWNTLDDRTFINNVQNFYHSRAVLERVMKEWMYFKKPVSDEELYQIAMASEGMSSREMFLPICRQLLSTAHVKRYSETSFQRIGIIQQYLSLYIDLNEENKFLMNITDEDMQEFVNTTIKKVRPAAEKDVIGKWTAVFSDNQKLEYDFHKDHTFHTSHTIYSLHPLFMGRIAINHTFSGKWAVENDSLVSYFDMSSLKVEVDENGITYPAENADSIRTLKNQVLSEDYKKSYLEPLANNTRQARASNIDRTGKRLELTDPQGQTTHYQRNEAAE